MLTALPTPGRHRWLLALMLLGPAGARADWEYTKWGMSPEQVAAASKGKASALPPAKRDRQGAVESGATGSHALGTVKLSDGFLFDAKTHGLVCVVSTAADRSTASQLESELIRRLGPPRTRSEDRTMGKSLKWESPTDSVELTALPAGPTQVMQCKPGAQFY